MGDVSVIMTVVPGAQPRSGSSGPGRPFRNLMAVPALAGALALAGCSGAASTSGDPADQTGAAVNAARAPSGTAEGASRTGFLPRRLLEDATAHLTLRPDQRAEVDKLETNLKVAFESSAGARTALRNAVADAVDRGTLDPNTLAQPIDAVAGAAENTAAAGRAALVRLHDILDPDQRNQWVDFIEGELRALHAGHRSHGRRRGLRHWADELGLSSEQRQKIAEAIRHELEEARDRDGGARQDWQRGRAHFERLLEAFRQDRFDAGSAGPTLFSKANVSARIERVLSIVQAALGVLTPEQRTLAATKIRTSAKLF